MIELDTGLVVSGQALQQTGTFSNSSLQGAYAMNFSAVSTAGELDSTAEFTANGTGNLTGITDINDVGTVSSGTSLSGTYTVGTTGRGPLTFSSGLGTQNMAVYMVNSTRALFVELDSGVIAIGELRHQ